MSELVRRGGLVPRPQQHGDVGVWRGGGEDLHRRQCLADIDGLFRVRWGLDAPTGKLHRRACAEVRTARALEPLESAGWVAFHDRLVDHERVPPILLGPPGAVVGHPHSFGGPSPWRARARRVLRLGRRPAPSTVESAELGDAVAGVLTTQPELAG